jgi:hypothetical protein
MQDLTIDQLKSAVPKTLKGSVSEEMVERVNTLATDPMLRESFRDNLLSYTAVLQDGKYKVEDYINAVRYVSYKLLGASNSEAYQKTFPDRWQRLVDEGADGKTISAYSTAYNKNKLVNKILEQTLVPSYVLNQDLYQRALNVQADLMMTAKSEKVRSDAANSLMTALKMPETSKIEIDMNVKEDKSIDELRRSTLELVAQQKAMIASGGAKPVEIAHSKIIQPEVIDADLA